MAFESKKFRGSADAKTFATKYRGLIAKYPFWFFGLPFMSVIVAASFVLTPATAIRYEKHDRKVRQMTREEELGVKKNARKFNIQEEYFRLAAKDLDNWEQKRIKRLPGEHDGVL